MLNISLRETSDIMFGSEQTFESDDPQLLDTSIIKTAYAGVRDMMWKMGIWSVRLSYAYQNTLFILLSISTSSLRIHTTYVCR